MIIVTVLTLGVAFCSLLIFGNIYVALAGVGVLLIANIAMVLAGRDAFHKKSVLLVLWFILLSHRALVPRTKVDESGSLFFVEVGATLAVLAIGSLYFIGSVSNLKIRPFEGRFWLLVYTVLAGISLLWTPDPIYSGFWFLRLTCVAVLLLVYFAEADVDDCRKFFIVTLVGSAPVILLPIIGYMVGVSHALVGAQRVVGFWVHPGVVTIVAFSVAVAAFAAILQGRGGRSRSEHLMYWILFGLGCVSGFLAAGKTGAIGAGIAVAVMLLIARRIRFLIGMLAIAAVGFVVYDEVAKGMEVGLIAHMSSYNFERLGTVQGRFNLWVSALGAWSESVQTTLLGRGFTSFRSAHIAAENGWDPGHAHNSYLNVLVDMGIVGAFAYIAMLWQATRNTVAMAKRRGRDFSHTTAFIGFVALVSLLIGATMDDVFGGTLQPTSYLLLGIAITLDRLAFLDRHAVTDLPEPARAYSPMHPGSRLASPLVPPAFRG